MTGAPAQQVWPCMQQSHSHPALAQPPTARSAHRSGRHRTPTKHLEAAGSTTWVGGALRRMLVLGPHVQSGWFVAPALEH